MGKRLLAINTIVSSFYQVVVIVCGFVLPRFILQSFGTEVNGLINSITQFLTVVNLMEMGVGAVVSSALYGPLAEKRWSDVGQIVSSADTFFRKIARILIGYVIVLIVVYPSINSNQFERVFTGILIVLLSINSFAQYYLGIVDNIILGADQRAYVTYASQTIMCLFNTIVCVLAIKMGAGILVVKGLTACIYLLRPVIVRIYIRRKYPINRKEKKGTDLLKNKWSAFAQHFSECILDSTDVIVLTIFSTLTNVSIYYVYNLVVYNIKNFFLIACSSGIQPVFGQLYAVGEKEKLDSFFEKSEWIIHNLVSLLFGITAVLLVPFVSVYTNHITDANYIRPVFAVLMVVAYAFHCLRLPYFLMIKAAGHYKQTQYCFIFSTIAKIIISILMAEICGLKGVAIGTIVAIGGQTIYLSGYVYRILLNRKWRTFWKRIVMDALMLCLIILLGGFFSMATVSYISWLVLAIKETLLSIVIVVLVNFLFGRKEVKCFLRKV